MTILFTGGPCDGLRLAPIEIQKVARLLAIQTRRGPRKFGLFPPIHDWPAIVDGTRALEPVKTYIYEMVNTPQGPQYQYDPGGRRFGEATLEGN